MNAVRRVILATVGASLVVSGLSGADRGFVNIQRQVFPPSMAPKELIGQAPVKFPEEAPAAPRQLGYSNAEPSVTFARGRFTSGAVDDRDFTGPRDPMAPFVVVDRSSLRIFSKRMPGGKTVVAADRATPAGPTAGVNEAGAPAAEDTETPIDEGEFNALFAIAERPSSKLAGAARDAQGERGKQVYLGLCFACHQNNGEGLPGAFPPLARSDFLLADRERSVRIVLKGLSGPITVNGATLNSAMPSLETMLTDNQIADVLTFVHNAWGNQGDPFKPDQVKAIRNEKP